MKKILIPIFMLASTSAVACPFCDQGGQDTALFIGVIFGLFALSMLCLYFFALKRGAFEDQSKIARAVIEAEGTKTRTNS
jgi:hypothetical protein